jgi:hypothetical protein
MTRESMDRAPGTPDASTQGVTLRIPTHMAAPSHALVLREGPKPTRPRGRIPRVTGLLALAHHFDLRRPKNLRMLLGLLSASPPVACAPLTTSGACPLSYAHRRDCDTSYATQILCKTLIVAILRIAKRL